MAPMPPPDDNLPELDIEALVRLLNFAFFLFTSMRDERVDGVNEDNAKQNRQYAEGAAGDPRGEGDDSAAAGAPREETQHRPFSAAVEASAMDSQPPGAPLPPSTSSNHVNPQLNRVAVDSRKSKSPIRRIIETTRTVTVTRRVVEELDDGSSLEVASPLESSTETKTAVERRVFDGCEAADPSALVLDLHFVRDDQGEDLIPTTSFEAADSSRQKIEVRDERRRLAGEGVAASRGEPVHALAAEGNTTRGATRYSAVKTEDDEEGEEENDLKRFVESVVQEAMKEEAFHELKKSRSSEDLEKEKAPPPRKRSVVDDFNSFYDEEPPHVVSSRTPEIFDEPVVMSVKRGVHAPTPKNSVFHHAHPLLIDESGRTVSEVVEEEQLDLPDGFLDHLTDERQRRRPRPLSLSSSEESTPSLLIHSQILTESEVATPVTPISIDMSLVCPLVAGPSTSPASKACLCGACAFEPSETTPPRKRSEGVLKPIPVETVKEEVVLVDPVEISLEEVFNPPERRDDFLEEVSDEEFRRFIDEVVENAEEYLRATEEKPYVQHNLSTVFEEQERERKAEEDRHFFGAIVATSSEAKDLEVEAGTSKFALYEETPILESQQSPVQARNAAIETGENVSEKAASSASPKRRRKKRREERERGSPDTDASDTSSRSWSSSGYEEKKSKKRKEKRKPAEILPYETTETEPRKSSVVEPLSPSAINLDDIFAPLQENKNEERTCVDELSTSRPSHDIFSAKPTSTESDIHSTEVDVVSTSKQEAKKIKKDKKKKKRSSTSSSSSSSSSSSDSSSSEASETAEQKKEKKKAKKIAKSKAKEESKAEIIVADLPTPESAVAPLEPSAISLDEVFASPAVEATRKVEQPSVARIELSAASETANASDDFIQRLVTESSEIEKADLPVSEEELESRALTLETEETIAGPSSEAVEILQSSAFSLDEVCSPSYESHEKLASSENIVAERNFEQPTHMSAEASEIPKAAETQAHETANSKDDFKEFIETVVTTTEEVKPEKKKKVKSSSRSTSSSNSSDSDPSKKEKKKKKRKAEDVQRTSESVEVAEPSTISLDDVFSPSKKAEDEKESANVIEESSNSTAQLEIAQSSYQEESKVGETDLVIEQRAYFEERIAIQTSTGNEPSTSSHASEEKRITIPSQTTIEIQAAEHAEETLPSTSKKSTTVRPLSPSSIDLEDVFAPIVNRPEEPEEPVEELFVRKEDLVQPFYSFNARQVEVFEDRSVVDPVDISLEDIFNPKPRVYEPESHVDVSTSNSKEVHDRHFLSTGTTRTPCSSPAVEHHEFAGESAPVAFNDVFVILRKKEREAITGTTVQVRKSRIGDERPASVSLDVKIRELKGSNSAVNSSNEALDEDLKPLPASPTSPTGEKRPRKISVTSGSLRELEDSLDELFHHDAEAVEETTKKVGTAEIDSQRSTAFVRAGSGRRPGNVGARGNERAEMPTTPPLPPPLPPSSSSGEEHRAPVDPAGSKSAASAITTFTLTFRKDNMEPEEEPKRRRDTPRPSDSTVEFRKKDDRPTLEDVLEELPLADLNKADSRRASMARTSRSGSIVGRGYVVTPIGTTGDLMKHSRNNSMEGGDAVSISGKSSRRSSMVGLPGVSDNGRRVSINAAVSIDELFTRLATKYEAQEEVLTMTGRGSGASLADIPVIVHASNDSPSESRRNSSRQGSRQGSIVVNAITLRDPGLNELSPTPRRVSSERMERGANSEHLQVNHSMNIDRRSLPGPKKPPRYIIKERVTTSNPSLSSSVVTVNSTPTDVDFITSVFPSSKSLSTPSLDASGPTAPPRRRRSGQNSDDSTVDVTAVKTVTYTTYSQSSTRGASPSSRKERPRSEDLTVTPPMVVAEDVVVRHWGDRLHALSSSSGCLERESSSAWDSGICSPVSPVPLADAASSLVAASSPPARPERPSRASSSDVSSRGGDIMTTRQSADGGTRQSFRLTSNGVLKEIIKDRRVGELHDENSARDEEHLEVEVSRRHFFLKGDYSIAIPRQEGDPLGRLLEGLIEKTQQGGDEALPDLAALDLAVAPPLRRFDGENQDCLQIAV